MKDEAAMTDSEVDQIKEHVARYSVPEGPRRVYTVCQLETAIRLAAAHSREPADDWEATYRYCEREWQKERAAFFDMIRDKVISAYIVGAEAVHDCWVKASRDNPFGEADFTEAAHDYYASLTNIPET